jgi:hypothetical protein
MSKADNITQANPNPPEPPVLPPAPKGPKVHQLNPGEKQLLMGLRGQTLTSKERIHDLNVALEQAQRELASVQAGYNAALASMGAANGILNPRAADDFSSITGMSA